MQVEGRVVITRLLLLSQDPQNQTFVVRDEGCMNGLVASLKHVDAEVILIASRALQFLSGHPQNKKLMREFPNLVENLINASATTSNAKTKQFCNDTLENLGVSLTKPSAQEQDHDTENVPLESNNENFTPSKGRNTYQKVAVYLDCLGDSGTCVLVQRILLNTPGVISVEFDKQKGAASVGTREPSADTLVKRLCEALNRAGLVARTKPRAPLASELDDEEEDAPEAADASQSLDDDSGYLDEADYYGEKESAVTRWGPSSLEARLEQQRREEEERAAQTGRILSKVGSALSSASSWLFGY